MEVGKLNGVRGMSLSKALGMAVISFLIIGGIVQYMFGSGIGGLHPKGHEYVNAEFVANETGVYVVVNVHFKEPAWVKGVAVSSNLWPVTTGADAKTILRYYKLIPVEKTYKEGDWKIVVPVDFGNSEIILPVWNGSVVYGENLIPLNEFGKVSMLPEPEREASGRYEVIISYAYHENPVILSTEINETQLQEIVQELAEKNASTDELAQAAKKIAKIYVESLKNGTTIIGYEGCTSVGMEIECYKDPISVDVVQELMERGDLSVRVKVVISIVEVLGTVEAHNITYTLKKHSVKIIEYDAGEDRVVDTYKKTEVDLHSPPGIPTAEKYAVVVIWAKSPYSPLHWYGTIIENPFLKPESG